MAEKQKVTAADKAKAKQLIKKAEQLIFDAEQLRKQAEEILGERLPDYKKVNIAFQVREDVLNKLKAIADFNGWSYVDVYGRSFEKLVESYEAKHGPVKPIEKRTGLNDL